MKSPAVRNLDLIFGTQFIPLNESDQGCCFASFSEAVAGQSSSLAMVTGAEPSSSFARLVSLELK